MDLEGRVAVVTGGGSGIGRGIALALGREGMAVAIADIEADSAQRVADELAALGVRSLAVRTDATDHESIEALASQVTAEWGAVNLLSNNIGVPVFRRLEDASEDDWAWAFEFNIMAMVRTVNVFLPHLRQAAGSGRGAHIVNTASTAGLVIVTTPEHGWGAGQPVGLYTTTKHAVVGYTLTLRDELAPEGIGVSVLCPGGVASQARFTAARNRPAKYGGAFDPGQPPGDVPGLTAEDVGRFVARGVRANRVHVLTHPEWERDITANYRSIIDDYAFYTEVD